MSISLYGLVALGWVLTGETAKPAQQEPSLTTDWSTRHLIFTRPSSAEQLARIAHDPRYWQELQRREHALAPPANVVDAVASGFAPERLTNAGKKLKRDWSQDLGNNANAGAGNYPAKFSFRGTTANCASATPPDYVAYSTGLLGAFNQANIVAFDNLYSGCTGTKPTVYWAYNTAGQVLTSPLISQDGTQVAFVQTDAGQVGTLVLIRWAASTGTVASPASPTAVLPGAYLGCTAPCMTTVILHDGSNLITDDTTSSVFYDYSNDIGWVGGARGWLHKITGVFNGTPTEVHNGVFPVQINTGNTLSSPVYDAASGNVFVGDYGGFLYSVNSTTAAITQSAQLDFGTGIVEAPIVDSTNGFAYVFSSSDGTANCTGVACSAVYQLTTAFNAGSRGTEIIAGNSVAAGTLPNPNPMYIGGFNSTYLNSTNATGNIYLCGNTGGIPTLYGIQFIAGVPGASSAISALTTATAACSPVADVPNPNTTGGSSERLFFSVQNNNLAICASTGGCVLSVLNTPWQSSNAYLVGQRILGNNLHVQTVITAGMSGATAPTWLGPAGALTTDGTMVWLDQGNVSGALSNVWIKSHNYTGAATHLIDSNGNIEIVTVSGKSGTSQPVWNMTLGGATVDNTATWKNLGAACCSALPAAGGTSGIIIDDVLNGTVAGTSQVYFSTLSNQVCGTSGTGGCAVQASQPGLN
ncbi:MAG: hypothetical protein ABSB39_17065 [Candidatus Sulfotelmatobacter sp.]